jgi:hypothetical protein
MTVSSEGLREVTIVNDALHSWSSVKRVHEFSDYFVLQLTTYMVHVIPLRDFSSPAAAASFIDVVHSNMSKN